MKKEEILYATETHIEVSEGDTKIVSFCLCPLINKEVQKGQLHPDNKVIMCQYEGQGADFTCPYFFGAVYPSKFEIDCRHPKQTAKMYNPSKSPHHEK